MFKAIYQYELKYWIKQPSIYFYSLVFLGLAMVLMAVNIDAFEESSGEGTIGNSPIRVYKGIQFFTKLILFLLPTIFGVAIYRDFKTNMHSVLYTYPFTKWAYLSAKFLSAFTILALIVALIGLGFIVTIHGIGGDPEKIIVFNLVPYLKGYFLYLLPNIFFFGALVFTVVTLSRNIFTGFIAVILILFAQQILMRFLMGFESLFLIGILEPFGEVAISIASRFWTAEENNILPIPITSSLVVNRVLWVSLGAGILWILYQRFTLSQTATSFSFRKSRGATITKNNFGSLEKVEVSKVQYDFSFLQNLKITWKLSNVDFKYIIKSWAFIVLLLVGLLVVIIMASQMNRQYGGTLLPVTWLMLAFPVFFFSMVINFLTFIYAGLLVHRARMARVNQLVDITPVPNWVLLFSKFVALVKMQMLLLLLVMVGGIVVQTFSGFYSYEIGHYIGTLFGMYLPSFMIWALVALWVQTLFDNPYLGLFVLILSTFSNAFLEKVGVEQTLFKFNTTPYSEILLTYSDLTGYGAALLPFLIYKFYWLLFGFFMLFWALLLWQRGLPHSLRERFQLMKTRFQGKAAIGMVVFFAAFLSLGARLYYEENVVNHFYNKKEKSALVKAHKKQYDSFQNTPQPRMTDIDIQMDIYPQERRFEATGVYTLVNKTDTQIDTFLVEYAEDILTQYDMDKPMKLVSKDSVARFDVWTFEKGLASKDSVKLSFKIRTKDNTIFRKNNIIEQNGTYFHSLNFPSIGRWQVAKIPEDTTHLSNMYRSKDADFVNFKAQISTSNNQTAITTGYLQKEWTEGERNYFQYASTNKVTNDFIVNSGDFEVKKDKWKEVDLAIYYHKQHAYNLDILMEGMKAGLAYCSTNFAPYQHEKLTIIEFARNLGDFAQSFANTMPFSETAFLRDVKTPEEEIIADLFSGTAHEVTHQWWGHQVIPANADGAIMLTEGMAEYVKAKVLQHDRGEEQYYKFLEKSRIAYLRGALRDDAEQPLMYNKGQSQGYIPYHKGVLVFCAMSDYLGEANFNAAVKNYVEKVRFKEAPYTTSIEMVEEIKKATPDTLQYLIKDLFETITLYDNKMVKAKGRPLDDGRYQIYIEFLVSKYRSGKQGKRIFEDMPTTALSQPIDGITTVQSLPLADYLDIGVFAENGEELYLKKHKVNQIDNQLSIIIDGQPVEVGIDPYGKMIDKEGKDNRVMVEIAKESSLQ